MPTTQLLADIPRLAAPPDLLDLHRAATARGALSEGAPQRVGPPISYGVVPGRDTAAGRQMMFTQFLVIMDFAERELLLERVRPAFPRELVDCRTTLERRIVYTGNCYADDVVDVAVGARLSAGPPPVVTFSMELTERRTKRQLALAEVKKMFAIPGDKSDLLREMERLLALHGEKALCEDGST
jgi:probable biosynthetic protein (TIGR04098 family)